MKSSDSGFMTLAFGRKYAELAIDLALSVREYHNEPISIAVDKPTSDYISKYQPSPFEHIFILDQNVHAWGAKFLLAEVTPYLNTVFLDSDILFLRGVPGLFPHCYDAPIAMLGEYLTADQDRNHHGYSTTCICAEFGIDRYLKTNSGLFSFNREKAKDVFKKCYAFYTQGLKAYPNYFTDPIPDEIVFGIVGPQCGITCMEEGARPMPWADEIPKITPCNSSWPLIHMIGRPNKELLDFLCLEVNRRRSERAYPVISETLWRQCAHPVPSLFDKALHRIRGNIRKMLQNV